MKITLVLFGLVVVFGLVGSSPISKRDVKDSTSLNEILIYQNEGEPVAEDEHGDREKRKIGVIKLGVTNGIMNFVFGKLDSFLTAKTKALGVLDESNKAKNAIYGIDNTSSATGAFISDLIGKKIQAGTASIGPLINSATTFISSKKQGLVGALTSKFAPLSSLSGGLSGGAGGSHGDSAGSNGGSAGGVLSLLTSLSSSSGGLSGGSGGGGISAGNNHDNDDDDHLPSIGGGSSTGGGATLGPYGGGVGY